MTSFRYCRHPTVSGLLSDTKLRRFNNTIIGVTLFLCPSLYCSHYSPLKKAVLPLQMEQKALVSCVAALLLLLQFAGFCLASEAPLQNVENQPEADNVDTPSTTTEDSVSHATEPKSKIDLSAESPYLPVIRGVGDEAETLMKLDTDRSGKLIAQYTTKTKAMFVTTTRTSLSTCFSATGTACTGRKRKKRTMESQSLYIGMG